MTNDSTQYAGECLCGSVRYHLDGATFKAMFLCHCSRCRKETGTVHASNLFFEGGQLVWDRGEDNVRSFALPGTRKARAFCATCGGPVARREGAEGIVVPAGTLDEGAAVHPSAHIFFGSRAGWEDQLASLQRFTELPH